MNRMGIAIGGFRGRRGQALARPRRARRSPRATLAALASAALALALAIAGAWWLLTSPVFAISRVESGPYRFSAQDEVDAALRLFLGRNIWTLDQDEVAGACAALPWVRSVHLRRRVPETLAVELAEWRPLISVAVGGDASSWVMIGDGRLLPWPDHLQPPGLPVLVGADVAADGPQGMRLADGIADAVMPALDALVVTGFEAAYPVDFLRLTTTHGLVLELERQAGRVILGREQYVERLHRYLLARDQVPRGATVDLRFADRITYETPVSATD